jgi:hypothetical protein
VVGGRNRQDGASILMTGKSAKQERNIRKRLGRVRLSKRQALLEGVVYFECSRFAPHHKHAFRWSAILCGWFQYRWHKLMGFPFYNK